MPARLSTISTGHLYNLRKTRAYRQRRVHFEATHSISIPIGERRCPKPEGQPGYLRVDTVHQGDRDGKKGLYHINAVDEVTQWQIIGATAFISEAWLMPVLEQFPFTIRGSEQYHSTKSLMAWSYVRCPLTDVRVLRTADLACSRSGSARVRFGALFFRDFDMTDGSFSRHPCYGAVDA